MPLWALTALPMILHGMFECSDMRAHSPLQVGRRSTEFRHIAFGSKLWVRSRNIYQDCFIHALHRKCLGYVNVPSAVFCGGFYPTTNRLCACDDPNSASKVAAFGTGTSGVSLAICSMSIGYSGGQVLTTEMTIFNHILPSVLVSCRWHCVMRYFRAPTVS